MEVFSDIIFWFLVIISGYWFIFFKLQERVYVLLPPITTDYDYTPFHAVFGTVLGTKVITLVYKIIFEQCNFDIFLVDWEKPKRRKGYKQDDQYGVNAWRSLFLLNEFNEL